MFLKIYNNLQLLWLDIYILLFIVFILCCLVLLWKHLQSYYYISKIPGLPGYPIIGNALLLRNLLKPDVYFNMFRFNGGFSKFWIGPIPVILVSDPEILQTVFTNPTLLHKGKIFELLTFDIFGHSLISEKVEKWKHNRKLCSYAFTQAVVNSFLPIFNHVSVSLLKQLEKEPGGKAKQFDVFPCIRRAALDAICATSMGIHLNSLKDMKHPFSHAIESVIGTTATRLSSPLLYPQLTFSFSSIGKEQKKALDVVWEMTNKVLNSRLEAINNKKTNDSVNNKHQNLGKPLNKNPLRKPFLDFLLDVVQTHPELTMEQIKDEICLLLMAGYETIAVTLAFTLVVFGARKDIQKRAYDEIFNIFGNSDRPVELEDFGKLEYLELVVKETLRLFPPVAHISRENLDNVNLRGYTIPAGTTFFISIASTHRNPKYWIRPLEFIPERFLKNRHPYAFIPFSGGARNCLGNKYAMMFMKLQLVNILRKFEVDTTLKLDQLHFEFDLAFKLFDGHLISLTKK